MKSIVARVLVVNSIAVLALFGLYLLIPEKVFYPMNGNTEEVQRSSVAMMIGLMSFVVGGITVASSVRLYSEYKKAREYIGKKITWEETEAFARNLKIAAFIVAALSLGLAYFAVVNNTPFLFEISLFYATPSVIVVAFLVLDKVLEWISYGPIARAWSAFWTVKVAD